MRIAAVIAAAGEGIRLGRGSKALVALNGRTILSRAIDLFLGLEEVTRIVVVGPPGRMEPALAEIAGFHAGRRLDACSGGDTRQRSVRAGLLRLEGVDFVLVHDAARPLASATLCRRVLKAAIETGAAFPGLPSRDAVKRVEGMRLVESLERAGIVLAQTPQAFRYELLLRAHADAAERGLNGDDDAQLVAATGHPVAVVEGEAANLKLTTPEDLELLEGLLRVKETVVG